MGLVHARLACSAHHAQLKYCVDKGTLYVDEARHVAYDPSPELKVDWVGWPLGIPLWRVAFVSTRVHHPPTLSNASLTCLLRTNCVTCLASLAMMGTNCVAEQPFPATMTFLPLTETEWSQRAEWKRGPLNFSFPGIVHGLAGREGIYLISTAAARR